MATQYGTNKSGNAYDGQTYAIQKAPGGVYHVYNDGHKVFMPASNPAPAPKPVAAVAAKPVASAARPVTSSAASAAAAQSAPAAAGVAQVTPDSQFFDETSSQVFDNTAQKNALDEQDRALRANYDEALRRMAGYETESRSATSGDESAAGLFYSGHHTKALDKIATEYARQRADALQGLTGNLADNDYKRHQLDAGFNVDIGRNLEGSVARQIDRDQSTAQNMGLALNTPIRMAGLATGPKPKPSSKPLVTAPVYRRTTAPAVQTTANKKHRRR